MMHLFNELDVQWFKGFMKRIELQYDHQMYYFSDDPMRNAEYNKAVSDFKKNIRKIEVLQSLEQDGWSKQEISEMRYGRYKYYRKFAEIYKKKYDRLVGVKNYEALDGMRLYEHYKTLAEGCIKTKTYRDLIRNNLKLYAPERTKAG